MAVEELAVFPLKTHVLPEGKLPLRIFEQRYLNMVKQVLKLDQCFAIAMLDDEEICPIATKVKIIDFELLPDQFLGLIVQGVELIELDQLHQDEQGLHWAQADVFPSLIDTEITPEMGHLVQHYKHFLAENPKVAALYPVPRLRSAQWVAQRWLEILPFSSQQKQVIIKNNDIDFYFQAINEVEMKT